MFYIDNDFRGKDTTNNRNIQIFDSKTYGSPMYSKMSAVWRAVKWCWRGL